MNRRRSIRGYCPLCQGRVLFATSSKGFLEVLTADPTDEGWIHTEEGFTHVYEDRAAALEHLTPQMRGFPIRLYELHYCAA